MVTRNSLTKELKILAVGRLAALRALSFEELTQANSEEVLHSGRWGFRGNVWTDFKLLDADTLRVAVLCRAGARWWPGYFHWFTGFRVNRMGARSELTRQDEYDLD
jgi:hypothetical protein